MKKEAALRYRLQVASIKVKLWMKVENGWWRGYVIWRQQRHFSPQKEGDVGRVVEAIGSALRVPRMDGCKIREYFGKHCRV